CFHLRELRNECSRGPRRLTAMQVALANHKSSAIRISQGACPPLGGAARLLASGIAECASPQRVLVLDHLGILLAALIDHCLTEFLFVFFSDRIIGEYLFKRIA